MCHHHIRPGERAVGDDHFTNGDTDANVWPNITLKSVVALRIGALERQRCGYGVRRADKGRQQGIATQLAHRAAVGLDGLGKASKGIANALVCERLVALHQHRGADDVRMQNDCQFAR